MASSSLASPCQGKEANSPGKVGATDSDEQDMEGVDGGVDGPTKSSPMQVCWDHLVTEAEGLSGRALRKLPMQAHAFFVQRPSATPFQFVQALLLAVRKEQSDRLQLGSG